MAGQLNSPRMPTRIRQRRATTRGPQPGGCLPVAVAASPPRVEQPVLATKTRVRQDDRAGPLILFAAATLVMVVVVALVDAVGKWWVLAPAMLIDLLLTLIVIAVITRLLGDDGESLPPGDAR